MSDDDPIVLRGPAAAEVAVPPDRYAVPAETLLGQIERQTPVTIGGPGWWLVDELMVQAGPVTLADGREGYEVLPAAEWGASTVRPTEQEGIPEGQVRVMVQYVATADMWVYQDAPGKTLRVDEIDPIDPMAWFGRLMDNPAEPPPRRSPRPARELPSLAGATVRWWSPSAQEWQWMKALSEPLMSGADITVACCYPSDYWRAVYNRPPQRAWVRQVPLHTVWAY